MCTLASSRSALVLAAIGVSLCASDVRADVVDDAALRQALATVVGRVVEYESALSLVRSLATDPSENKPMVRSVRVVDRP